MKHESDGDTDCNLHAWYSQQRIGTGNGGLGTIQNTAFLPITPHESDVTQGQFLSGV